MTDIYISEGDRPVKIVRENSDSIIFKSTSDPNILHAEIPTAMLRNEDGIPIKVGVFQFDVLVK